MKKIYLLVILTLVLFFGIERSTNAQCTLSQGPDSALNFVNDASIGTYPWSGPNAACCSDNNWTLFTYVSFGDISNYLKATSFGFSIPVTATICGIEVNVERSKIANPSRDYEIKLVKNNIVTGTNHASLVNWPDNTDSVMTYGSNSDLWGATWTPAEINAAGFGAAVSTINMGNSSSIPRVDQITVKVYYSTGTSTGNNAGVVNEVSLFPNPSSGTFILQTSEINSNLIITNVLGEKIYETKILTGQVEIDLSDRAKGIYFVQVSSLEGRSTKKIIIQ